MKIRGGAEMTKGVAPNSRWEVSHGGKRIVGTPMLQVNGAIGGT